MKEIIMKKLKEEKEKNRKRKIWGGGRDNKK